MSNEAKVMWWAIAKAVAVMAVCCAIMVGCGLQEDVDDMGLPSQVVSWPLTGGLDTGSGPLSVQPGSFLQLDDLVQERAGEWRNRYGFTQSAADTVPLGAVGPVFGRIGDAGMFTSVLGAMELYRPSLSSGRWTAPGTATPEDYARVPVVQSDSTKVGFAQSGNLQLVATLDSVSPKVVLFDTAGKTHGVQALGVGTYLRVRCAATAGKMVAFLASAAGNLDVIVVDTATGVFTGPTTIKAGTHATAPYLDALWYGGSTITVVVRMAAADAVRFIEYNPATGALSTDVALAAIAADTCLALCQDFSSSGTRYVAFSHSTPVTKMLMVTSAGAITTTDTMAAAASSQIAGVGYTFSAQLAYGAVFQLTSGTKPVQGFRRLSGATSGPTGIFTGTTGQNLLTIESQAWSYDGSGMHVLMGMHSTDANDPQDSWVNVIVDMTQLTYAGLASRLAPLQAAATFATGATGNASLYQRPATSARTSAMALPVLASYANEGGTVYRRYSVDVFSQQIMDATDIATVVNHGPPVPYKQTAFVPINSASFIDEGNVIPIGTTAPPTKVVLNSQGAGSLTAQVTYGYVQVIEVLDSDGNVWRSPPSAPLLVPMGANTANNVTATSWELDARAAAGRFRMRVVLFRTIGGGSVYRRIASTEGASLTFADTLADSAINNGNVLYTTGETATAITPRFSHVMTAKDRLWGVNADFRTELWASKNLRPGSQPEFTNVGVLDIDDNFGDITGISAIDDNTVVFKRNAIYFVQGDGFNDDGSGTNFSVVNVTNDVGAIPGSPIVQAGEVIYFVSDRGIYSIDRSGSLQFVGLPVDRYINQALIQTPERIWDACWVAAKNEVRFLTDNYILVYNRKFATTATIAANSTGSYWSRWKFAGGKRCAVINNAMVVAKSDGTIWREGDQNQLTDQGAAISGVARMSWVNAANQGGSFRLRRIRATGLRTAGGGSINPTMTVFFNNDEASFETYAPQAAITAGAQTVVADAAPRARRCTSFSAQLAFPPGDNTFRLDQWSATVGVKQGSPKDTGTAGRWQ